MDAAKLPKNCYCGRPVAIRWSGPIGPDSRPVLLVCRTGRCAFTFPIPANGD